MSPKVPVTIPPSVVDGAVSRLVEMPDGSGRVETWDPTSKAWVPGGATVGEVGRAGGVSEATLERLGVPRSDWG